jgi:predicted nucleotidyltransferase
MLTPTQIENKLIEVKPLLHQKYFVSKIDDFGSYSANMASESSDVDFLYVMQDNLPENEYADNFFDLLWALEALFNRKVDMVAEKYLRNRIFFKEVNETKKIIYNL